MIFNRSWTEDAGASGAAGHARQVPDGRKLGINAAG
jgi:hypothetical protein